MQEKFENAVRKVNEKLSVNEIVYALWYSENGELVYRTVIKRIAATPKDDGWHLIGWNTDGKEFCLGGAVLLHNDEELYKP
jgi:hypothetical protein